MNLPAHVGAPLPSAAVSALSLLAGEAGFSDSGTRTLVGVAVVLVVLGVVITAGLLLDRGSRT